MTKMTVTAQDLRSGNLSQRPCKNEIVAVFIVSGAGVRWQGPDGGDGGSGPAEGRPESHQKTLLQLLTHFDMTVRGGWVLSYPSIDSPCECEHNNPYSQDARLFPSVGLAVAPAVTMEKASSLLP